MFMTAERDWEKIQYHSVLTGFLCTAKARREKRVKLTSIHMNIGDFLVSNLEALVTIYSAQFINWNSKSHLWQETRSLRDLNHKGYPVWWMKQRTCVRIWRMRAPGRCALIYLSIFLAFFEFVAILALECRMNPIVALSVVGLEDFKKLEAGLKQCLEVWKSRWSCHKFECALLRRVRGELNVEMPHLVEHLGKTSWTDSRKSVDVVAQT